jgi:hypothetical protein
MWNFHKFLLDGLICVRDHETYVDNLVGGLASPIKVPLKQVEWLEYVLFTGDVAS